MTSKNMDLLPGERTGMVLGTVVAGLIYLAVIALVVTSLM
jgi:hypothetical protein